MPINKTRVLRQIDDVLGLYAEAGNKYLISCEGRTHLNIPLLEAVEFFTVMRHTIERFRPSKSGAFGDDALGSIPSPTFIKLTFPLDKIGGLLMALRTEYAADRL